MKELKAFWNCGDNSIIEFALLRARLNDEEKKVVYLTLDRCLTQVEIAEELHYSVRKVQSLWSSAVKKIAGIPWVIAYARELMSKE